MKNYQASTLLLTSSGMLLAGCSIVATGTKDAPEQAVLIEPFEYASAPSATSMLGLKFARLAEVDPTNPLASRSAYQTLSLFGREDLISETSGDYRATGCAPAISTRDLFAEIEDRARRTSIVIVNESHERSEHRGFTAEVVRRLRPLGYDTLAMEALANPRSDTPEQFLPPFMQRPGQPYLEDGDGWYLSEAAFGRLGRLAKAMQYRLLPYEAHHVDGQERLPQGEQIALREEQQASNLAAFVRDNPTAKMIVHVGYSHAMEVPRPSGAQWMAHRLKNQTGIDPLTISQTTCRGAVASPRLAALPTDQPPGTFDLVIDHPGARFVGRRPYWRVETGDHLVPIPAHLFPHSGWRVIEARPVGEPSASVPMDRVAIRSGEDVALLLPPGRYALRIMDMQRQ